MLLLRNIHDFHQKSELNLIYFSNTGLKVKNIKYKRDIIITEVNNTLNP